MIQDPEVSLTWFTAAHMFPRPVFAAWFGRPTVKGRVLVIVIIWSRTSPTSMGYKVLKQGHTRYRRQVFSGTFRTPSVHSQDKLETDTIKRAAC